MRFPKWALATTRFLFSPEVVTGVFLIAVMFWKASLMRAAASGPIFLPVLQHDAGIFGMILLLYTVGALARRLAPSSRISHAASIVLGEACFCLIFALVFLYAADAFDYYFFNTRLYASDVITFSSEHRGALSLVASGWHIALRHVRRSTAITVAFVLLMRSCYLLVAKPVRSPLRIRFAAIITVALVGVWSVPLPAYVCCYPDKPLYENFVERNENFFVHENFSDSFRRKVLASAPTKSSFAGRGQRLNIILVIVESLSAYDSQFFSGVENWTPQLDQIAERETALPDFFANGWTTIGGLISLLGRSYPFVPEHTQFNIWGSPRLTDFLELPDPVPQWLAGHGYNTEFIAAGDLTFLGQDRWLQTIGFQKIVGEPDARFSTQKIHGPFHSIPDHLLYQVALEEARNMPKDKPYFLTVQTFWSHRPFMDPSGGKLDGEEYVIRETDAQLGTLYRNLQETGFFEHGLLFITGDHRAMENFRKAEFDRFGSSAIARIPAVVVTHGIALPAVIRGNFQQRDFGASIEALVSNEYYLGPYEGSFLSQPPKPSDCVLHARGDDRDLIFVKCGAQEGTIKVSGDSTRLIDGDIPDADSIVLTVNRTRARSPNNAINQIKHNSTFAQ
jgi:lipoteichoic acid synthase